jgi:hypothetical protein
LQFGGDASSEIVVSWHTLQPVRRARVLLGLLDGKLEQTVEANETSYTDAKSGQVVYAYHAKLGRLQADAAYLYSALHEGAQPEFGTFRTAPRGRARFTFTSFGDQGTPTVGKRFVPPAGVTIPTPLFVNDNRGSPAAGDTTLGVERLRPLFHLLNGDLCYANVADDRVRTWWDFWENNSRSARNRPWMPAAGNHENEVGNGPHGHLAYQTRFELPGNGSAGFEGNWYAFTVGAIRVLSLNNDDVCLQDGGFSTYRRDHVPGYRACGYDPYIHGYSRGRQRAWLEAELAAAQRSGEIDWIVVCMHQVAMSSAHLNGADLGIRRELMPLFDTYGVDLVVAGHEHHYERTFPVRGVLAGGLLTPAPRGNDRAEMDTRDGTVHMIIGGGGHSVLRPPVDPGQPPEGVLIIGVGPGSPQIQRRSVITAEPAPWSAYRNLATPFGFASFDVVPAEPGGTTSITVTYHGAAAGSRVYTPLDRFVMRKPVTASLPAEAPVGAL